MISDKSNRCVSQVIVGDVLYEFVDSLQQLWLELGLNHDEVVQHHVLPRYNTQNIYHSSVTASQRLPLEVCIGSVSHFSIGKRVVDFLLVLIERFSLGVMAEALRANIGWKSAISLQREPVDPEFQVEGVAPTNHSSSQKTRLNDLSYGVKIWTDLSSVLSQFTRLTDGQINRRTAFSSLDRVCTAFHAAP